MDAEANRLKKFEPLDTLDFVDFSDFEEISIENRQSACKKFYEMPKGSCHVLLTTCFISNNVA